MTNRDVLPAIEVRFHRFWIIHYLRTNTVEQRYTTTFANDLLKLTMTSINSSKLSNPSLAQQDPHDPVQIARTLRRIKRRLLLEQCGVALPYALQSTPQVLFCPDSQKSVDCTMGVGMGKIRYSMVRVPALSQVSQASPSTE